MRAFSSRSPLHDALERPLLPVASASVSTSSSHEQQQQAQSGRRRIEQQPLQPKRKVAGREQRRDAAEREQRRVARLPARRGDDEHDAQQQEHERLGARRPGRAAAASCRRTGFRGAARESRRPASASPSGVFLSSTMPSPVTPISTSFCVRAAAGSNLPSRTSTAEMKRSVLCGEIVDAHGAVLLGRRDEVADADALDRRPGREEPQRRRADGDAQHLDRERRHQRAADAGDERNAADHAAGRLDRDEAAAGGRAIERVEARQHARERGSFGATGSVATPRLPRSLTPNGGARSGMPVGVGAAGDRRAPIGRARRARAQARRRCAGSASSRRASSGSCLPVRASRRSGESPSGFRHQDVDADRGRPLAIDVVDQLREHEARPRPLAERGEALLVDLDDRRRHRDDLPRRERLVGVEPRRLQARVPRRIERQISAASTRRSGIADEANVAEPARGGRPRRAQASQLDFHPVVGGRDAQRRAACA